MEKKKIILILIIISIFVLILWGFFRFRNENRPLVYENNIEKEVEVATKEEIVEMINSQEKEKIVQSEIKKEDSVEVKPEIAEEKKTETEANKEEDEKQSGSGIEIKERLVSWGFSVSQKRNIDTIILHTSYNILGGDEYDLDKIILEYKEYGVAPHYVINRKGDVFRLVNEKDIAYHAGESKTPDGRSGVNNFSIGIEVINSEKDSFTDKQYVAINNLIQYLKYKYEIKYILGHNQISPGRKTDPWNINWDKINK